MEWRYDHPTPQRFVLDGTDLWIHQLDDGRVFVRRQYDGDDLKAALRFAVMEAYEKPTMCGCSRVIEAGIAEVGS